MKQDICLDANILISRLSPDESSESGLQFLKHIITTHTILWAPALINFEVAAVIVKKQKLGLISVSEGKKVLQQFYTLPLLLLWDQDLMFQSTTLQKKGIKSLYDASYLAAASLKQIPLITDDQEFLKAGKKLYPAIFSPEQWMG
jgi:predicted nucleic acid-binding protein